MTTGSHVGNADQLTRTTLRIVGDATASSSAQVVRALRRVPGVLLAEMDMAGTRTVVAHDSAVPLASLLAATADAGVRATLVADRLETSATAGTDATLAGGSFRSVIAIAATLLVVQILFVTVSPGLAKTNLLVPFALTLFWAFVFFSGSLKRRT